jgi:hypothetical protein
MYILAGIKGYAILLDGCCKQFMRCPDVIRIPRFHRRSDAQGLMHPAEVVKCKPQRVGGLASLNAPAFGYWANGVLLTPLMNLLSENATPLLSFLEFEIRL